MTMSCLRATKKVDSVVYAKVDRTALSMSLAEGLVSRFLRETKENQCHWPGIMQEIRSRRYNKIKLTQKALEEQLPNAGILTSLITSKTFRCVAIVETDGYCFQIRTFSVTKRGIRVSKPYYRISQHAVARYILRARTTNWWEIFDELGAACHRVSIRNVTFKVGDEYTAGTDHGLAVFKIDTDLEPVCVTWIDSVKVRPEQADNTTIAEDISATARKAGETIMDHYHIPVKDSQLCWQFYTANGGKLSFAEFRDDSNCFEFFTRWLYRSEKNLVSMIEAMQTVSDTDI